MKDGERYAATIAYEPTEDKIYNMGGIDKSTCEYYDINKDEWTLFPSLSGPVGGASASILHNRYIYLYGGCATKGEIYNTI